MYDFRWEFFYKYILNKDVLEIGPAELVLSSDDKGKKERWIHGKLLKEAKSLMAVEINQEQVDNMQKQGFNVVQGSAENFHLNKKFEVVVAGELIEHLSNPGNFLECVKEHLTDGGVCVMTTPNRYSFDSLYSVIKKGKVIKYSKNIAKHVTCFDEDLIKSLVQRHGFDIVEYDYCSWVGAASKSKFRRLINKFIKKYRPALASTIVISIKKKKD